MMPGVAFVDAEQVAFGVVDEGHAAYGRLERLHLELHALRFQVRDGCVEILYFKADRTAGRRWLPIRRARAQ